MKCVHYHLDYQVKNKTIIGLKLDISDNNIPYWFVKNKTIIGLKLL